ncbi:MAG: adenosylmethionine--8-amino-7-oxononanoate transaminase [Gammaproteobacteria bacterium]|nr:adenosylmethionine--8-amino-7-oxononanoate transaminase [Gammaproteobacteria bacterium]MCP4089508.1 adenosylmethionine--8-amino-7-oxononanoate transaminase [Gammaproteobacteria bacterium]MCP4276214.1 adenosylmethionine--8-amino-7-oxononanoate transaminase [Gammaproteobacteria bacterium]MCP4832911.1 adenosylmethionine--8-amino-7-oxononanoate transaminase [Gammaproteobacteria bacterium]MCP4930036.1 adenosylmethionine--8-amino-7-oxononanoate transaminase [Gammaproteobacteria bacterium]
MTNFDRTHIWHPYTSITNPLPTYPVKSASGSRLTLEDGTELIDGMSSWWCAIHGYNHPVLNAAAETQLGKMSHVMFGGLTHEPAIRLARQLVELTPDPLQYIFFSDSGSVSVDVALKMALQFWHNQGRPEKHRMLTVYGGYHGDTFGAMSVCDPITGMHKLFSGAVNKHLFAPRPEPQFGSTLTATDLEPIQQLLETHNNEIAAMILEPIVQGAGGMWFYSAEYLNAVAQLCKKYDVLLILDEIATGFGRTGKLFASEHAGITPDIMCLGKALTGGYMSLAATLCNERVRDGISANDGILMHGPTFMANPLACNIASASIDLLLKSDWQQKVATIEQQLTHELGKYCSHDAVADIRVLGAIGVVELHKQIDIAEAQKAFVAAGVWIRPFGKLAYLMPPYTINTTDLSKLTSAIGLILE